MDIKQFASLGGKAKNKKMTKAERKAWSKKAHEAKRLITKNKKIK